MKTILTSLLLLTLFSALLAGSPRVCRSAETEAITSPSQDVALSFVMQGRLDSLLVKEGDPVQAGQLLARLDDGPEQLEIEQLKVQAEDRTRIEAARAELAQKQVDLKKLRSARAKGAVTDWEVEHVTLGVRIAELSLKAAVLEHEQLQRRYNQAVSQLERMSILAPIDGRVEKVAIDAGEAAKTLSPVIQLVKTDPLWVEVPVPLNQAGDLAVGNDVWVVFPNNEADQAPNGRVIHMASVADAASETLRFRIEVTNPGNRPAGERVRVSFAQPSPTKDLPVDGPKVGDPKAAVDLSSHTVR